MNRLSAQRALGDGGHVPPDRKRPESRAEAPERCPTCARPLVQPLRGRKRLHCSHACRQTAYRRRTHGEKTRNLITLVQADARLLLPTLPDESVDLILTDPPYHFERGTTYFRTWFPMLPDDEWAPILSELHRVLRSNRHCYIFCDWRSLPIFLHACQQTRFRIQRALVWDKDWLGLGSGAWRASYELILWLEKGTRQGNSKSLPDVLRYRRPHRGYPTEKPLPLLKLLIQQASQPGELVLDPFCGSGSVGRAAIHLGRVALVSDIDTTFAERRLRHSAVALGTAAT